jgi:hypothetical protein
LNLSNRELKIVEMNNDIRKMEKKMREDSQFLRYIKRHQLKAELALEVPEEGGEANLR